MASFDDYERQGFTWERAMAHAARLAVRAGEMVGLDPTFRPVAVILTPDASEIRDSVPQLVRDGLAKPGDWVPLLVSRDQALAMLRANAPATLDFLEPEQQGSSRRLPVVVVTAIGVRLGFEQYEVRVPQRSGRVPVSLHAMLLCREAFRQAGTGKWCVIGIHDCVRAAKLPCLHHFAVFVSVGDFTSGSRLNFVVRHEQEELCRIEAEAGIGEAMGNLDLGVPFPPLQLPHAGIYHVDLRAAGRLLATRQLLVQEQTP